MDYTPLINAVIALLSLAATWALKKFADKQKADTTKSKTEDALLKLGAIVISMAGRAWDKLSPQLQAALADGRIAPEERAEIEATVKELLKDFSSEDDLKSIAAALGLPVPGIVAKIAAMLIEKFAAAHDPYVPNVSDKAYPVSIDAEVVVEENASPGIEPGRDPAQAA